MGPCLPPWCCRGGDGDLSGSVGPAGFFLHGMSALCGWCGPAPSAEMLEGR